jgi:DNA-binding transcriptional ArsR family regulator
VQCAADYVFKALADPTRRELFERLTRDGEQTVHALSDRAGVSQPMVSKHLAALKRARLVNNRHSRREAQDNAQTQALAPLFDSMRLYGTVARDQDRGRFSEVIAGTDSFC